VLDWLFPHKCVVCLDILTSSPNDGFCKACKDTLMKIAEYCDVCGRPLTHGYTCECEGRVFEFTKNRSVFVYDDVMSNVIYAFKYGNHPAHGKALGKTMARHFDFYFKGIDLRHCLIIPTPMFRPKERLRGFNQADILAREIARYTGILYDNKSLLRIRDTAAQSGLSAEEREINLANAFKLSRMPSPVAGKTILLVDDILTTGSTLNKCAAELLRGGAASVYGYTLSATVKIKKKYSANNLIV